jgi:DnaK suppressor protein
MDGEQTQRYFQALIKRRELLLGGLDAPGNARSQLKESLGNGLALPEMVELAQTLEQLERDQSLEDQERSQLKAVERALAKVALGEFGVCESCEEEIPDRRLEIVPEARFCARCQSLEERERQRHARHGGPIPDLAA